ncbi:MAG: amino acid aminotransferase [Corticimicrobacter sp.]|uniref:amino acid aminotransferase n=1 Tax=Corticimicrobacter sp. TaxID=2678536 RepID=UPI0032DA3979
MFAHTPHHPGDPILSIQGHYRDDTRPAKANLTIGFYYDEQGRVPDLASVVTARDTVAAHPRTPGYLPMGGDPSYCAAMKTMLFDAEPGSPLFERIATVQTLGGSGALKVGADLLKGLYPQASVHVPGPTWDNHRSIFQGAGFEVGTYPYFDAETGTVAYDALLSHLESLPEYSVVLLHACCHNPTGTDLAPEQWDEVIRVLQRRHLLPFLDLAYLGFAHGVDEDRYLLRALVQAEQPFLLAQSCSKIFSLYAERIGSLSVFCADAELARRLHGQLEAAVRRNYSSPPAYGARIVDTVLRTPELLLQWQDELNGMRERIRQARIALGDALAQHDADGYDWGFIQRQNGLFSYDPGLGQAADRLRDEFGVYILPTGRICVAGVTPDNTETIARAFATVMAGR